MLYPSTAQPTPSPDYTSPESKEKLELKLVRIRATEEPFRGTIFFNPGGPGYSGRQDLYAGRELWQTVVGKHHDIVAWDYRGTGTTLPFSCFATEAERINFYTETSSGAVSWRASVRFPECAIPVPNFMGDKCSIAIIASSHLSRLCSIFRKHANVGSHCC